MKHGYGERWEDIRLTVDKVGEDPEGNHLVEVSVHDQMAEINVRMHVSKAYYGSMIPWLAARVTLSDLAVSPYERARRVDAGRLYPEVILEDKAAYMAELDSAPELSRKAAELPEHLIRGHAIYLAEGRIPEGTDTSSTASLHNAHKLIFDYGLPDALEFVTLSGHDGKIPVVMARWYVLARKKIHHFYGFDWRAPVGAAALEEFLEMLNVNRRISPEEIRPQHVPHKEGPKEWSPHEMQSFMLIKGRDYGRPNG